MIELPSKPRKKSILDTFNHVGGIDTIPIPDNSGELYVTSYKRFIEQNAGDGISEIL